MNNIYIRFLCTAAAGLAFSGGVQAQGTTASIFGQGPAGATVIAQSTNGMRRHTTISSNGRYKLSSVPVGTYSVSIEKDDKAAETRSNLTLTVGRGAEVDFACENDQCAHQG
jgi:threonine dehydrogenase-like Zn-dependent dehydrogenase